jgi:hypothetical protein
MVEPSLSFLTCLNRLPKKQVWAWMCFVHFEVYFPVLAYATIIITVAVRAHQYQQALVITLSNVLFFLAAVQLYFKTLQAHSTDSFLSRFRIPALPFKKLFFLFPLYFIWSERKLMFLLTKLFSLVYLYGFIQFYEPYRYDIRPVLLSFLLIITAHGTLIFQVRHFENENLLFTRNLPIGILKRFFQCIGLYFVLLTPELLFVWKGYPLHFRLIDYSQIILMVLSIPAFLHAILYTSIMNSDEYMKMVFAFIAVLFFLILYDLGILLFVFVLILAFVFFYFHFYEYERANAVKTTEG